jgi:hypothetical protein
MSEDIRDGKGRFGKGNPVWFRVKGRKKPESEGNKEENRFELRVLHPALGMGQIIHYEKKLHKFILSPGVTYLPDYKVILPDDTIAFIEFKGFREKASILKFKLAAARFWYYGWFMVQKVKGGYSCEPAGGKQCPLPWIETE